MFFQMMCLLRSLQGHMNIYRSDLSLFVDLILKVWIWSIPITSRRITKDLNLKKSWQDIYVLSACDFYKASFEKMMHAALVVFSNKRFGCMRSVDTVSFSNGVTNAVHISTVFIFSFTLNSFFDRSKKWQGAVASRLWFLLFETRHFTETNDYPEPATQIE